MSIKTILRYAWLSALFAWPVSGADAPAPNRGDACAKYAVRVSARVQAAPPQIALVWPAESTAFSHTLYRRFMGEREWSPTPIAVLDGKATGFVDNQVKPDVLYEYRIDRSGDGYMGRGYLGSGIELAVVENRGQVILLVEESVAAPLQAELALLQQDLVGDGWQVLRHDVAREAPVAEVKALILADYRMNPAQVRTVFLFGHVPVPYSGSISPDGHPDHRGAWPADLVYGDVGGINWTDEKSHADPAARRLPSAVQRNEPGDGKFDPSTIPAQSLTLEVGRVDLADLPQFPGSEIDLLRRYLVKNHVFRHAWITAEPRGLIDDHFGAFSGEAFGSSAWGNFAAFFGAEKSDTNDWFTTLSARSYLWAYGCGGGSHDRAGGVGTTADFVQTPVQAVFTMLFGSYFGDWNRPNNFMRAALANAGPVLTCAWDGRPHWYVHHMAMGRNIGYSALRTQNNNLAQDYLPCNNVKHSRSGRDEESEWDANSIHVALMGDPTLRLQPLAPPRDCRAQAPRDGELTLGWRQPEDPAIVGCRIYKAAALSGPYTLLTPDPVTGTTYTVTGAGSNDVYLIRSLGLQRSASGSYWNTSQGVFLRPPAVGASYAAPQISGATLTVVEDGAVNVAPAFANERDRGSTLLVSRAPQHGTLEPATAGGYVYAPSPDYHGADHFTLIPRDALNDGPPAEFDVVVQPAPDAPRPIHQMIGLADRLPRPIKLTAIDPDVPDRTLRFEIVTPPKFGKLAGSAPEVRYEPVDETTENDEFRFIADNGYLSSATGSVTICPALPCARATGPVRVDGDLGDWRDLAVRGLAPEAFRSRGDAAGNGTHDCRFVFDAAYDDTNFYVAVAVVDDRYDAVMARDPWEQDGVEIRLDARPAAVRAANCGAGEMDDFLLLAMSPGEAPGGGWWYSGTRGLPVGTTGVCVRTSAGFNTEVAIPLAYLDKMAGEPWRGVRLNLAVDDCDGDQPVQLWWQPDWRSPASYAASGTLLKREP